MAVEQTIVDCTQTFEVVCKDEELALVVVAHLRAVPPDHHLPFSKQVTLRLQAPLEFGVI